MDRISLIDDQELTPLHLLGAQVNEELKNVHAHHGRISKIYPTLLRNLWQIQPHVKVPRLSSWTIQWPGARPREFDLLPRVPTPATNEPTRSPSGKPNKNHWP